MKVFVTGATGFIGSRIVKELIQGGHQVIGLTRSDEGAKMLTQLGATPYRGTLDEPESLRAGAAESDGVIHCAFDHDFSKFVANCEKDKANIKVIADALKGTNRPLLITSGVGIGSQGPGKPALEDIFDEHHQNPRIASEYAGRAALELGVTVSVVRLPQVHDTHKQGLISMLIPHAKEKKVSVYIDEGSNRWSACHVTDVAHLYKLAFERGEKGARYNAVAEEGVSMRHIAETIGAGLKVPVISMSAKDAAAHFGWLAMFAGMDLPASSEKTRRVLNWNPTGPDLITDLKNMDYSKI